MNYWQLILHFVVSSQTISGKSTLESIKCIKYRPLIRKVSIYTGRHWYLALWWLTELCNACFYLNVCVCGHALSCPSLCNPMDYRPPGSSVHGFPSKNTGVGSYLHLQGIFLTQGSNPHLLCLLHRQGDSSLYYLGSQVIIWTLPWKAAILTTTPSMLNTALEILEDTE